MLGCEYGPLTSAWTNSKVDIIDLTCSRNRNLLCYALRKISQTKEEVQTLESRAWILWILFDKACPKLKYRRSNIWEDFVDKVLIEDVNSETLLNKPCSLR